MLWVRAFHIIFAVCWFAGLFYLPRLFVYHAECRDDIGNQRFKIMERKLFWSIMTPSGVLTTIFGLWSLMINGSFYMTQGWMWGKLFFLVCLWIYHWVCLKYLLAFKRGANSHSHRFYRWFNELTTVFLLGIVILVVVKP